jgi:hypothetical protein
MNDYSQPGAGKISVHGNGFGAATPEAIEKRAREIAMIEGRDANNFTDTDWDQARLELQGASHPIPQEETKENAELVTEWQVTTNDTGHRVPRPGLEEDDETLGEQLVEGGIEEAAHDQMLEARKEEHEQEGGIT